MNYETLAEEIIGGRRLTRADSPELFAGMLTADLDTLCHGADRIREHFCKNKVDFCTIINARSGRCSENCRYCSQSGHYHTACQPHGFIDEETILKAAKENQDDGADRFSLVTSGRTVAGDDFKKAVHALRRIHDELEIETCASFGFMTPEQLHELHEAGCAGYHENIETSRRYFPKVCTTHTFDDKITTIKAAKAEGMFVCCGGIIGMGETWEDRIDMALTISELHPDSIPINVLIPVKGTPLENQPRISDEDVLRTLAIFRYINPESGLRLAGGRNQMKDNGASAFRSGVNAAVTGNMLTAGGSTIQSDLAMVREMGRDTTPCWKK